jgi:hypothetical protein
MQVMTVTSTIHSSLLPRLCGTLFLQAQERKSRFRRLPLITSTDRLGMGRMGASCRDRNTPDRHQMTVPVKRVLTLSSDCRSCFHVLDRPKIASSLLGNGERCAILAGPCVNCLGDEDMVLCNNRSFYSVVWAISCV